MGFKAASIFVNELGPGYFGTLPSHEPKRARDLCHSLGLSFASARNSTFEDGLWPPEGTFALGTYKRGVILADQDTLLACSGDSDDPMVCKILQQFPQASVLCVTLHSVINHWGYSLYEKSKLVRRFLGDADSGIALNEGDLQPEEQLLFSRSRKTGPNRRIFELETSTGIHEYEEHQVGETLVFLMASRFFGQRLDRSKPVDLFDLRLELFTK